MNTYQKLLDLLEADMVIHKKMETVQEKCAGKVQEILLGRRQGSGTRWQESSFGENSIWL